MALGTAEAAPGPMSEVTALATVGKTGPSQGLVMGTETLLAGGALLSAITDSPVGLLSIGSVADLVVHRCRPAVPVDGDTWSRPLEGAPGADWVIVGGKVILKEGQLVEVDLAALAKAARRR